MAKKTTVPKKTAKLDDKQLDQVTGGFALTFTYGNEKSAQKLRDAMLYKGLKKS